MKQFICDWLRYGGKRGGGGKISANIACLFGFPSDFFLAFFILVAAAITEKVAILSNISVAECKWMAGSLIEQLILHEEEGWPILAPNFYFNLDYPRDESAKREIWSLWRWELAQWFIYWWIKHDHYEVPLGRYLLQQPTSFFAQTLYKQLLFVGLDISLFWLFSISKSLIILLEWMRERSATARFIYWLNNLRKLSLFSLPDRIWLCRHYWEKIKYSVDDSKNIKAMGNRLLYERLLTSFLQSSASTKGMSIN